MSLKYRISNIGWYNFELLAQTLLKAVIGPGVTSLGGSKDKGRDAVFKGSAAFPTAECQWTGRWVFQVKYIDVEEQGVDASRSALKSAFGKEASSILNRRSPIDNYILLTDVPLSAQARDALAEIAVEVLANNNFAVVDGKEICQLLDLYPDIRRSFPQLLGLADLDVIVNRDLYARSEAYLRKWQPRLATYVQTEAHSKALSLLKKKYFIVLDGPPEAGKTTIAAALALIHATEGYEIIDVRSSNDVFRPVDATIVKGKKREKRSLFVADDAVGSITLEDNLAQAWSRDLEGILMTLSSRRLLVWTARRYVLEEALAKSKLGEAVANFPRPNEVLVEVGKLTTMQKAEILYNHAKNARLNSKQRELIREHAFQIIAHPNFTPLRISQLVSVFLRAPSARKQPEWDDVLRFLNDPSETWIQAFRERSASEKILLSSMLDYSGGVLSENLRNTYESRIAQRGGSHLSFQECVGRLDHSFLSVTKSHQGEEYISLQHPSLRDMLLLHLRADSDARKRYISLATPFGLSSIIRGLAEESDSGNAPQHSVVPQGHEEFQLFLERLSATSEGVLTPRDWETLLGAVEGLLPRKTSQASRYSRWVELGLTPPSEPVEPTEIDLLQFAEQPKGRITRAVLEGFAGAHTLANNQRLGLDDWTRLLTIFYRLSAYLSPPPYPQFTGTLCNLLSDSIDSLRLANVIRAAEPLVLKQRVRPSLIAEWEEVIQEEATTLIKRGEGFGPEDDPYDFDGWRSESREFLQTAMELDRWTGNKQHALLEGLEDVIDASERPHELEGDEITEVESPGSGSYWTVVRLFEDL